MPMLSLDVYSHGVRVYGYTRETFRHLAYFLEGLALKEPRRLPANQGGRMVMELKKRFYGIQESRREFYIHRHHLDDLKHFLKNRGIDEDQIVQNHIAPPIPYSTSYEIYPHFTFDGREYQIPIVEHLSDDHYSRRLDLYMGGGKAQPLTAKIKVPGGWKRMGDIQVGDIVTAWDGTPTTVTGVYPQGKKTTYQITFSDGRQTTACDEHLWSSYHANCAKSKRWAIRTTKELLRLSLVGQPCVYIPLPKGEEGVDSILPIEPYLLGVILGDGCTRSDSLYLSTPDEFILEEITQYLPDSVSIKHSSKYDYRIVKKNGNGSNPLVVTLKEMGIFGKRSFDKYVPSEYLDGSRSQRLALLQGLLDTDGTVSEHGSVSFCSTSQNLAKSVQYLVRSIGGIASISIRNPTFTYNGEKKEGRQAYQVNIRHTKPSELFRLPRKKDKVNDNNQYSRNLKLKVKHIEYIGSSEMQCISIAHPDRLYVTDDFIVTHNTFCTLSAICNRGHRVVIMLAPKYFGLWLKALRETYVGYKEDDCRKYATVSGSDELKQLITMALDGQDLPDIILISNVTYRTFIEAFEKYGEALADFGWSCPPQRFHEVIGAGIQVHDEFQDDPGLVFRVDIFTNIAKQIYLSATPYTGSEYVTRMIDVMIPEHTQCPIPDFDVYADAIGLLYSDPGVTPKDYLTPFKNTYNHARYEKRMLKSKRRLIKYQNSIVRVTNGLFVQDRQPGQKMLILCATVEFITTLVKFLRIKFPDLKIGAYVAGVPYAKVLEQDITVSTIKSAGTGVDIPDLRETLMLQATDSKKDNVQIFGRLRRLKNFPNVTPRFTYMVCNDIPKHLTYAKNKRQHFAGRVRNHRMMRL